MEHPDSQTDFNKSPNPQHTQKQDRKLWLASISPRRRLLLQAMGLSFYVQSPKTDELDATAVTVESIVMENALLKARSLKTEPPKDSTVIIGADTLVLCDGQVLSKPDSKDSARKMLQRLSGRKHDVLTGIALVSRQYGENTSLTRSQVFFRNLSEEEIEKYLSTQEPYDKAGSYAIQGLGAIFIERIEGSYTNVVGLPVEQLLRDIEQLTKTSVFEWFSP